jgi:hypothetical protein
MMYFIPRELIAKCPTLRKLPRKIREIMQSEPLKAVVESDQFLNEIMDVSAAMAFRHFGFSGWKEHYSGFSPVWKLSYSLPLWAKLLESETGWGLQALYNIPSAEEIPFFDSDYINETMSVIVKRAITEQNWQPILDVVKKMPCEEDYEPWDSLVRRSFRQRWYHFRYFEKRGLTQVSLEDCKADEDDSVHYVEDKSARFKETVESNDFVERFKAWLSPKDWEILKLRADGYTYEEIAEQLEYKNHSGVIKRMKVIQKAFEGYEDEQTLNQ